MSKAISNTSPLLYLYRVGAIDWLPIMFDEIWTTEAVRNELLAGQTKGYDVPISVNYPWLRTVNPKNMPSEWLALDLGAGELSAMALALENPSHIILLDDGLARRMATAAGLTVWGTLKGIEPMVYRLHKAGMWISDDIKRRILKLAGE